MGSDGMGVLHMAFAHGNDDLGRSLLERGADPAARNRAGMDYRDWAKSLARARGKRDEEVTPGRVP